MSDFPAAMAFSLRVEAGYQADPGDAGNYTGGAVGAGRLVGTNHGVTSPTLARFRHVAPASVTAQDMRDLTTDEAVALYATLFWNSMRGDDLPHGVNLSTMDMNVNSGNGGSRCLQRLAGVTDDGWIGSVTLAALAALDPVSVLRHSSLTANSLGQGVLGLKPDGVVGPKTIAAVQGLAPDAAHAFAICVGLFDKHLSFYKSLDNWSQYAIPWASRLNSRTLRGCQMALAPVAPDIA